MKAKQEVQFGGCRCEAIRYRLQGEPNYVSYCHCHDCRRSTGAPVVVYSVYLPDHVEFIKGECKRYLSSPGVNRTFCSDCGTSISYEAEWQGKAVVGFLVGTLDNIERFPPERHVFDLERVSWFKVADHLPRYDSLPGSKL